MRGLENRKYFRTPSFFLIFLNEIIYWDLFNALYH